jgi:hypothetical protein
MAFIRRTNLHVEKRLELAAITGRNPEGMIHFGAALHAVEDLFAHSNWVEIALSKLLGEKKNLLPQLKGDARRVFDYSTQVEVGKDKKGKPDYRPVLTTGSFTGADTKISLSSEFVTLLTNPLPDPKTDAEGEAEERFIAALLKSFEGRLESNPEFHQSMKSLLVKNGASEFIADQILGLPLVKIYNFTTWLPAVMPEDARIALQRFVRGRLSELILQPAGQKLQAEGLETRVADTSLITFLRESERKEKGQFTQAEETAMQETEKFGGSTVKQQKQEAQAEAGRHVKALEATPEAVIAGPSHSQIAKDHSNSPFFGLAFKVATVAVRKLRDKMLAAWQAIKGAATTAFDFRSSKWPEAPSKGASEAETKAANDASNLYHTTRVTHRNEAQESFLLGSKVVNSEDEFATPYNLAAMRKDSADRIRNAANALRTIAGSPDQGGILLTNLSKLLGKINPERTKRIQEQLLQAARVSRAVGRKLDTKVELPTTADNLDAIAMLVETSIHHSAREITNKTLVNQRKAALDALIGDPSIKTEFSVAVLMIIDEEIATTAVAYTSEQRKILEGYNQPLNKKQAQPHLPELAKPLSLTVSPDLNLPPLSNDPEGKARLPAVVALLQESRTIITHPYEGTWWVKTVEDHVAANQQQILADIEARNEGVSVFRRPGEHQDD